MPINHGIQVNSGSGGGNTGYVNTALRFDATKFHNVDHGGFWHTGSNYTTCWWDALVRPAGSGYMISAGYGSHHNVLWGFSSDTSLNGMEGNMYIDGSVVSFASPINIPQNTWHYLLLMWDQTNIYTYCDGICVSQTSAVGTNRTANTAPDIALMVGGSDHQNASMDLAWIRGFENGLPTDQLQYQVPYHMQRFPRVSFDNAGTVVMASFCADYTQMAGVISDHSPGLLVGTTYVPHPGVLSQGSDYGDFINPSILYNATNAADLPQWVSADIVQTAGTPGTAPNGAVVYDSFGRNNTPFWNNTAGLGSTEGGTAGVQAWAGSTSFWTLNGLATAGQVDSGIAYVDSGSATQDVRVIREGIAKMELYLNYTDASNYIKVVFNGDSGGGVEYIQAIKRLAGVETDIIAFVSIGAGSTSLRVTRSGSTLNVYENGSVVATGSVTGLTGTKAGFQLHSNYVSGKIDTFSMY